MKNTYLIITLGLAIIFTSCSNNQEATLETETTKNTYNIELINNEKWKVNDDMMIHIKNMESEIKFTASESNPNYEQLGIKLDKHIGLLTSNCTMTGKAHDELHKWLLPFIDLVNELNKAKSIEEQKASFNAINEAMKELNTYFI